MTDKYAATEVNVLEPEFRAAHDRHGTVTPPALRSRAVASGAYYVLRVGTSRLPATYKLHCAYDIHRFGE